MQTRIIQQRTHGANGRCEVGYQAGNLAECYVSPGHAAALINLDLCAGAAVWPASAFPQAPCSIYEVRSGAKAALM
jgi:hypothetical protein